MRNFFLIVVIALFTSCQKEEEDVIVLKNNSGMDLINHPLTISKEQFGSQSGKVPLIKDSDGQPIASQMDDLDGDGKWDELAFEYSLQAGEERVISYEWILPDQYPVFEPKANVYLGHSPDRDGNFESVTRHERPADHVALSTPYLYQYEGPGWESELVAFRSYFDSRNGKDIFGKSIPQLYVDSIGIGEDYHVLQDWGLDILKVGNSLGAGALALLRNDSVYRLGETDGATFEIIADGPVRAIFRLAYSGWKVGDHTYGLEETISIWGSKRWYESVIDLTGGNASDTLVTGIVNLKNVEASFPEVTEWNILATHGKQSENNDMLGMGLLIPTAFFAGMSEAPGEGAGVTNTYTAYLAPFEGKYRFLFYAGWEGENEQFADRQYFEDQLINEARQLIQPVTVDVK